MSGLSYAVVTPVLDEASNLARLFECLERQSERPVEWLIVDTGSQDGTREQAEQLACRNEWVRVLNYPQVKGRGGPIVRAFQAGVDALERTSDIVVKLDADVSFDFDYCGQLVSRFERNPMLGIASGACWEYSRGEWRQRHVTGTHVWGASRAYRIDCLRDVRPLDERMGWDGIDAFKANVHGWKTTTFDDLPFRHHRGEATRERSRWRVWYERGDQMHYLGYRPSFVVLRATFHARRDPRAVSMIAGWLSSTARRRPQHADSAARGYVRQQQRLRELPRRAREALGLSRVRRSRTYE